MPCYCPTCKHEPGFPFYLAFLGYFPYQIMICHRMLMLKDPFFIMPLYASKMLLSKLKVYDFNYF